MPAIALVIAAAKAGCFIVGSLVHEVNELMKRLGVDHDDTPRASCLLINDEQFGLQLQEIPKESPSPSKALILYASREVILSSSSRSLAILTNDNHALEATFDVIENVLPIMKSFKFFAAWAWFRARFIALALMRSALHSVITDMKMTMSFFIGSVSESVVEKKSVTSILFLIQANSSRLMTQTMDISNESARLLKSRYAKSMAKLLGQIFPDGSRGRDLPNSSPVGDSALVEVDTCAQHYLAMVITCFKRALAMIFSHSTSLRLLQLDGLKVMTLVFLLCSSISLIGWSIPMMIFEGNQSEQGSLQKPLILEDLSEVQVETGAFSSITSQFVYLSDGTSNALSLTESINNSDDLQPVSMAIGTSDRQVEDLAHLGLAKFNPIQHLWPANDFSFTSTDLEASYLRDDIATSVSLVDWNIIQSNSGYRHGFGTAHETRMLTYVYVLELLPSKDRDSSGIATEHFDGYILSTIEDEAFGLSALQNQSFVELELGIAFDGDTSTTSISIAAGPPREHSAIRISSLSREVNVYANPMHVDYRCYYSMAVQVHEAYMDLDYPGLVMLFTSIEIFYHCIRSESPPFTCVLGDLSSDGFGTSHFSLVVAEYFDGCTMYRTVSIAADEILIFTSSFVVQAPQNHNQSYVESLGRSILSRSASDGNASSMQMVVAELDGSDDIYPMHCQHFDRSSAVDATCTHPLLRIPSQLGRTWASDSISSPTTAASPSLRFGALEESTRLDIFRELRQLAWILLLMATYCNSDDGATNEPGVLLSSESDISPGTDLDLEDVFDNEIIFADEENGADEALVRNTYTKSLRHEVVALRSELGRHWKSPSKRRTRTRRSYRIRSRPKYFEPTWA